MRNRNFNPKGEAMVVLFVGVWILNLLISFWNCYAVGHMWVEAKHAGGWRRFIAWCGALMADAGFTWCTLLLIGLITYKIGWLNHDGLTLLYDIGYVLIIPVVLFAGWAITFDSWARAYRDKVHRGVNVGVAGYNTFASMYNTYNAASSFGDALGQIFDELGKMSKNKDSAQIVLVLILLMFSFGLGTLITWALITRWAANDEPMPVRDAASAY